MKSKVFFFAERFVEQCQYEDAGRQRSLAPGNDGDMLHEPSYFSKKKLTQQLVKEDAKVRRVSF